MYYLKRLSEFVIFLTSVDFWITSYFFFPWGKPLIYQYTSFLCFGIIMKWDFIKRRCWLSKYTFPFFVIRYLFMFINIFLPIHDPLQAVSVPRRSCVSPCKSDFNPRPIRLGFMVNRVVLIQVYLRDVWFPIPTEYPSDDMNCFNCKMPTYVFLNILTI